MTKKYQIITARIVKSDLNEIWNYVANDSPQQASKFINKIEKKLNSLKTMPERCPTIPENELLGTKFRHLIIGNYRVIFSIRGDKIVILRIIHGARLLDLATLS